MLLQGSLDLPELDAVAANLDLVVVAPQVLEIAVRSSRTRSPVLACAPLAAKRLANEALAVSSGRFR